MAFLASLQLSRVAEQVEKISFWPCTETSVRKQKLSLKGISILPATALAGVWHEHKKTRRLIARITRSP